MSLVIEDCSICRYDLKRIEKTTIEPCGHHFHYQCVLKWKKNCPLCRGPIEGLVDHEGHQQSLPSDSGSDDDSSSIAFDPESESESESASFPNSQSLSLLLNSHFQVASDAVRLSRRSPVAECVLCYRMVFTTDQRYPCPRCQKPAHYGCIRAELGDDFDPMQICDCNVIPSSTGEDYEMKEEDESHYSEEQTDQVESSPSSDHLEAVL